MKKIRIFIMMLLLLVVASFAEEASAQRRITGMDEMAIVINERYPELFNYYMEGVLKVNSLREYPLPDGGLDYKIKYSFVKYRYHNHHDMMQVMKVQFPEVYNMYVAGIVDVSSMWKYVDKPTGQIMYGIRYRSIYDFYYDYYPRYGGVHLYYMPRPRRVEPPFRPAPRIEPNRPHKTGGNRPPHNHGGNRPPQNHGNHSGGGHHGRR